MKGITSVSILLLSMMLFAFSSLADENGERNHNHMEVFASYHGDGIIKQKRKLALIPGGSNLIIPEDEGRLATLDDVLKHQSGLLVSNFFGGADQPRLNIRGSGVQSAPLSRGVTLLQDGLPLNDADGGFHISLLEPRESKIISVRRGANATSPVSNALGGELDFISYTGRDKLGRLRYEYGSFGRQGWHGAIGGGLTEQWDGRLSVSGDHFPGYRDHSSSQRNAIRTNVGFEQGNFTNRTWLSWTDLRFDVAGSLSQFEAKNNPTSIYPLIWARDPRRNVEQARAANYSIWQGQGWQQALGFWAQHTHDNFVTPAVYVLSSGNTYGILWNSDLSSGELNYRTRLSVERSDMARDLRQNRRETNQDGKLIGRYTMLAENQNLVLGLGWQANEDWYLNADVKGTHSVRNTYPRDGRQESRQSWVFMTPKWGVIWSPQPQFRGFANISWNHEAPSFREILSNNGKINPLVPQKAVTMEVGGEGQLSSNIINWDLTLYRSIVKNELISFYDQEGNSTGTFNYRHKTLHQGIEAGLKGDIPLSDANIEYRLAWMYNDFRFLGGEYQGKRMGGIPSQQFSAELLYKWQYWRLGPNLHWLPVRTPVDHANRYDIQFRDKFAVWGFKIDYRHPDGWSTYLSLDNLTNKRYATASIAGREVTSKKSNTLFPGMGRSINGGFTYHF
ncbi:MAG: hypothetical protein RLY17_1993 [Pseudomonadota bacterium]